MPDSSYVGKQSLRGFVMHKAILMLLLAVMSSSAMAEWVNLGEAVRKHPESSMLYASIKEQSEYNCKEEQSSILYQVLFSENMGKGKRITKRDPEEWGPIEPNTVGVKTWKFACGK